MATLKDTNSIVDFLKLQGRESSFGSRRNLYNQNKSLRRKFGSYQGTAEQNRQLLQSLRAGGETPSVETPDTSPSSITFTDLGGSIRQPGGETQRIEPGGTVPQPTQDRGQNRLDISFRDLGGSLRTGAGTQRIEPGERLSETEQIQPTGRTSANFLNATPSLRPFGQALSASAVDAAERDNMLTRITRQEEDRAAARTAATETQPTETPQAGATPSPYQAPEPTPESTAQYDAQTAQNVGTSASDIYTPSEASMSEADLINNWLNSTEGKLAMERRELENLSAQQKAEATKQALEEKYKSEKETLENNLAEKGLAFSGIRGSQVRALADSLAASALEADREFASKLLENDLDFREAVISGVGELIKAAQEDDESAIKQLNKAGYAVIGNRLVPTLSARNASIDDIRADAQLRLAQQRYNLAYRKFAQDQADKAGGGERGKFVDFINSPEALGLSREQLVNIGLRDTNLTASDLNEIVNAAPPSPEAMIENANFLVASLFDESFGNLDSTDLKEAKEEAKRIVDASQGDIESVEGIRFKLATPELRDSFKEQIDLVTLEDVK